MVGRWGGARRRWLARVGARGEGGLEAHGFIHGKKRSSGQCAAPAHWQGNSVWQKAIAVARSMVKAPERWCAS